MSLLQKILTSFSAAITRPPFGAGKLADGRMEIWSRDSAGKELQIIFNPNYGGAPLDWRYAGIPLIDNFGGTGANCTWEFGNDATMSGCNGVLSYPMGDPYYCEGVFFNPMTGRLQLSGAYPAFWLSHQAIDDAIPAESVPGWRTLYLAPPAQSGLFTASDTPIIWQGSSSKPSGLFFVGNEMKSSGAWSERCAPFRNGNMSGRMRVSFKNASADAYAGWLIRKTIQPGMNEAQAYNAPGYMFLVNKNGGWALHNMPVGNIIASGSVNSADAGTLLTAAGGMLEFRTYPDMPGVLEGWINNKQLFALLDANTAGEHLGVITSCLSGSIKLGERCVIDRNYRLSVVAQAQGSGCIDLEFILSATIGVNAFPMLYRANLPVMFMDKTTFPIGSYTRKAGNGDKDPGIVSVRAGDVFVCFSLDERTICRVAVKDVRLNGVAAPAAHALLSSTAGGQKIMHFNCMSVDANQTPEPVSSASLKMMVSAQTQ